jgi:acetylornithine/succinyldiaminopimelate/putrescine aminotransferase
MENALRMGELLKRELQTLAGTFPGLVTEIRGRGLMLGMELTTPTDRIVASMREKGILINATDGTVLRFVPPLIIEEEHIGETVSALRSSMEEAS